MFTNKIKITIVSGVCVLLVCGVILFAQSSQTGNVTKASRTVPEGPVVDYAGPDSPDSSNDFNLTGTERDRRHAKSASYDRPNSLPIKEEPGTWPVNLSSHWWLHLPALPVTESDAIALGTITGSRAFFSKDKHAVYSEFSLQVEQILKDKTQNISQGAVVTTTRYGGIVRFPSGTRYVYRLSRQGWPSIGSRYVLFLRKNQSGDFDIVTGYELREGVAEPLDGTDLPDALPFKKYAGALEPTLLDAIKSALANAAAGEHNL